MPNEYMYHMIFDRDEPVSPRQKRIRELFHKAAMIHAACVAGEGKPGMAQEFAIAWDDLVYEIKNR